MKRYFTRKKTKAQALAEFALVLPILLLVIFAIVDFGWVLFNYTQLYNSMREGLRYASVQGYTTPPQYENCLGIRQTIYDLAKMSGIQKTSITIVYDDGTPITVNYIANTNPPQLDPANSGAPVNTADTGRNAMVAYCAAAATTLQETKNTTYAPYGHPSVTRDPTDGDRVYIEINVQMHFLTPFFNGLYPSGLQFHLQAARSIYPNGIQLQ